MRAVAGKACDIALLDLRMPRVGGLELTEKIRSRIVDAPWLVALTAHVDAEAGQRSKAAGFDARLGKPVWWPS